MDVREKLVELLKTNACPNRFMCDPTCRYYGYGDCFPDRFADHLIAHGVTVLDNTEISDELRERLRKAPVTVMAEEPAIEVVQEWISVKDRLPIPDTIVLVFVRGYVEIGWYDGNHDEWRTGIATLDNCEVTHWMPLPQLPKGE